MKNKGLKILFTIILILFPINANANIICNDGTESSSCSDCHQGCCSQHDGCAENYNYSYESEELIDTSSDDATYETDIVEDNEKHISNNSDSKDNNFFSFDTIITLIFLVLIFGPLIVEGIIKRLKKICSSDKIFYYLMGIFSTLIIIGIVLIIHKLIIE